MATRKTTKKAEENGKLAPSNPVDISEVLDANPEPEVLKVEDNQPGLDLPKEALDIINNASAAMGTNPNFVASMIMSDALVGSGHKTELLKILASERQVKVKQLERQKRELDKEQASLNRQRELLDAQARALGNF